MMTDSPLRNIIARGGRHERDRHQPAGTIQSGEQNKALNVAPLISRLSLCRAVVCAQVILSWRSRGS
jgi:hypothetical protein